MSFVQLMTSNLQYMRTTIHSLAFVTLLLSTTAAAQDWGIGFRLGDPSGLTVKRYWNNKAFEVSVGRSYLFTGNKFYNKAYERWYDRSDFNYDKHEFLSYAHSVPVGVQLHYLIQNPVGKVNGLSWYYGFGAQIRVVGYQFSYRYKVPNDNEWIYVENARASNVDLAADAVLGMEYTFPKAPVSLFVDGTVSMEVFDDPFLFFLQGGTGVRFRF